MFDFSFWFKAETPKSGVINVLLPCSDGNFGACYVL